MVDNLHLYRMTMPAHFKNQFFVDRYSVNATDVGLTLVSCNDRIIKGHTLERVYKSDRYDNVNDAIKSNTFKPMFRYVSKDFIRDIIISNVKQQNFTIVLSKEAWMEEFMKIFSTIIDEICELVADKYYSKELWKKVKAKINRIRKTQTIAAVALDGLMLRAVEMAFGKHMSILSYDYERIRILITAILNPFDIVEQYKYDPTPGGVERRVEFTREWNMHIDNQAFVVVFYEDTNEQLEKERFESNIEKYKLQEQ